MTTTRTIKPVRVQSIIDSTPMTLQRWAVVTICFIVALLDGFDTQSIAFTGTSIAEEFALQPIQMTWIITASTIGMTIGAMSLGSLGDRIGRKRAVIIALVIFGIFSLLASIATAPWQIVILRFLIGLGMGGATPALLALTAEYSPLRSRGVAMTAVLLGLPGGALLGGVVAAAWLPVLGWRGMFLLGGALPVVMILFMALAPESPSYLAGKGTPKAQAQARRLLRRTTGASIDDDVVLEAEPHEAKSGSAAALLAPKYRAATLAIWAVYLANWIAWFLLLQWMPTALNMLGLSKATAATGTIVVNGAFILFAIPLSILLPRVKARTLLLFMFACGIAVALGLGSAGTNWALVFTLIGIAGFGVGGQQLVLNYLIANAYPTQLRGTATGYGIGIGRLGAIVGSALGGLLLSNLGTGGYFRFLALPLVIAAIATWFVRPASSATGSTTTGS